MSTTMLELQGVRCNPAELESLAVEVAQEVGEFLHLKRPEKLGVESKSSATDQVTVMDRQAEQQALAALLCARPDDGVLGEEGAGVPSSTGVTWVVDPLDGTTNYLYRLPNYAVSIAAVVGSPDPQQWDVVAGAICAPALGTTWSACREGGARRNGVALASRTHADTELGQALVATGFGYKPARRAGQGKVVAALLPHIRDIRRMGAAALDLCAVADGTLDAYYERGLGPWDFAAGSLIAAETGCIVSGLRDERATTELVVAAPPNLHQHLIPHLQQLNADRDPSDFSS